MATTTPTLPKAVLAAANAAASAADADPALELKARKARPLGVFQGRHTPAGRRSIVQAACAALTKPMDAADLLEGLSALLWVSPEDGLSAWRGKYINKDGVSPSNAPSPAAIQGWMLPKEGAKGKAKKAGKGVTK